LKDNDRVALVVGVVLRRVQRRIHAREAGAADRNGSPSLLLGQPQGLGVPGGEQQVTDEIAVTLSEGQLQECEKIARARRGNATEEGRLGRVTGDGGEFEWELRGVQCEMASYNYLIRDGDLLWVRFTTGQLNREADIDGWIEVKGVAFDRHNLLVPIGPYRTPLVDEWAYLKVSAERVPTFTLRGWLWGLEIRLDNRQVEPRPGQPAWQAARELRSAATLFDYLSLTLSRASRARKARLNSTL
jgi:hypothetical protein